MYRVFKFGGASIKDASSITNVSKILKSYIEDDLVIVFSAIGKVTNMLEKIVDAYFYNEDDPFAILDDTKQFHLNIVDTLFNEKHSIHSDINNLFVEIEWVIEDKEVNGDYSYIYDQIVSLGEFISTKILSTYLNECGLENNLIDARDLIRTDNTYRNAKVDWQKNN